MIPKKPWIGDFIKFGNSEEYWINDVYQKMRIDDAKDLYVSANILDNIISLSQKGIVI